MPSFRTAWVVAHVALVLLVGTLFDVLLRKPDTPFGLVGVLLTLLGLVLTLRALAGRRVGPDTWLTRTWRRLDGPGLAMLTFFLGLVWLFDDAYMLAASDGREYFVQVRSLVMDWDLDFANENATLDVRGTADRYAFGAALLWTPFFLACHWWLGLLEWGGFPVVRDGYGNPYQIAVGLGTLAYGCAGLVLVYRVVREYVADGLAVTATVALCAGSFLLWYLTVEGSMVHGVSMFATTLFLFLWHRTRDARSARQWALLGLAAGLMTMVRWQNALFVVFPLADAVRDCLAARVGGAPALVRAVRAHAAFVGSGLVAFTPQLWFWHRVRGHWLEVPVGAHGVSWLEPEIGQVLYSSHHGLFAMTPLVYASVAGLILLCANPRHRLVGGLLVAVLLGQLYVNSTVENWWGGWGFGARRFASCTLAFTLGLAAALRWTTQHPRVIVGAALAAVVLANTVLMTDVRRGVLPADGPIPFDRVLSSIYARVGNPFSFPLNAVFAMRYGGDLTLYDRLGTQTFNNFHLNVGSGADARFLVRGWSTAERSQGFTFRWADGTESSLLAPLKEAVDYRLRFRCAPFSHPGSGDQVMQIRLNEDLVETLVLRAGWHDYEVVLPQRFILAGVNDLRFGYRYAVSPRNLGLSRDTRALSVQFDTISLVR